MEGKSVSMRDRVCRLIEENRDYLCDLSDTIWGMPELGYKEYKSSKTLMDALEQNGFNVESGLIGIPTAFKATYGSGKPVIAFLGEYDALAGLSQEAGKAEWSPIVKGGPGHGCGHNTITTVSIGAAVAMKTLMEEENLPGTVVVFGCPAEEQGCGKSFMARGGVFDGTDVAIAPHPLTNNGLGGFSMLANLQVEFHFSGIPAHAASAPDKGRSALDAASLMIVGTQFLREHIPTSARIHHAYLDAGGTSPNVVQASAALLFYIRAPKSDQVREIYKRVQDIAKGAALMTGTKLSFKIKSATLEVVPNNVLGSLAAKCWADVGPCKYSDEAWETAKLIAPACGNNDPVEKLIDTKVPGYVPLNFCIPASSDVGDVSFIVPTLMISFAGLTKGTPQHSWQWVSQGKSALMHDGLIQCSKVMALFGMEILKNPEIAENARKELDEKGLTYECLIPGDVQPDI